MARSNISPACATLIPKDSGKWIFLTPSIFAEVDRLARTEAGAVVEVIDYRQVPGLIGRVARGFCGGVYIDAKNTTGDGCMTEVPVIQLVNAINLDEIANWPRPELAYSALEPGDRFRFTVLHEICHCLTMLDLLEFATMDAATRVRFTQVDEARADRFAWQRLYPGRPIVKNPRRTISGSALSRLERKFPEHKMCRPQLPTARGSFVPTSHVRKGVPYIRSKKSMQVALKASENLDKPSRPMAHTGGPK